MTLTPYLYFNGQCEEALAFYTVGDSSIFVSDGQRDGPATFAGFSLTLELPQGELEKAFANLAEHGLIQVSMAPTPFAAAFGMVMDQFGVLWTLTTLARQP